jgi:hypothetical protein
LAALPADPLEDRPLFTFSERDLDRYLRHLPERMPNLPERVIHLARKNDGQPYEIYLLGEFPFELHDPDPIYCLSRSDCLTFCEHMYAMALNRDWWSFLRTLQRIRYRDGIVGMLTRNHYTLADWNPNNAFLFDDLTPTLGGGKAATPLHQICRRARFFARFGIGQDIPDEPINDNYIPTANVPDVLDELRNGDFVNIIRGNEKSQWCGHTGLIAIDDDGTVNFLHSARPAVREEPLLGYLATNKRCLGIKILRLHADAEERLRETLANNPRATEITAASLNAALAATPLMSREARPWYTRDWARASRLQSLRLEHDTPTTPGLQRDLEVIERRIAAELDIPDDARAFGVLDVNDARLALIRPDQMFYGASVPKICIAAAYFETHPDAVDQLDPDVERELQLMIKRSSNELAAKYSQLVGLDKIQEWLTSERYRFYDAEHGGGLWCGKHYGHPEPRIGDPVGDFSHAATVRQCLRYYLLLEQGRLVSAAASARLKQIFAAPLLEFHNDGFVRGLNGRPVTILRKDGLWEDWHLDTARVQHDDQLYLMAGMVHHPRGEEYLARMAAAVDEVIVSSNPPAPYRHDPMVFGPLYDFFSNGRLIDTSPTGGIYESGTISPSFKFNEVLVSWNINAPASGSYRVSLRVGRSFDNSWTPYLLVGEAGDWPASDPRITACDSGRIDVDYFRSDQRFDRLAYRVEVKSDSPETTPTMNLIAICASDITGIPTAVAPRLLVYDSPPAPAWQRILPVPFRNQITDKPELAGRICSPTAVAMVMAYRGVDVPVGEVADACHDPVHDLYGNWPCNIQGAYSLGVPGYLTRFATWDEVRHAIANDQPLVISIAAHDQDALTGAGYTPGNHLLVLTGFDGPDRVTVNDPAFESAELGQRTYLCEDLEQVWLRNTGGLAYVLLPPHNEQRALRP